MTKPGRKISFSNLSNPFQRFRSQTGISQEKLAELLGLGQAIVSKYESGGTPSPRVARRFVELAKSKRIRMSIEEIYSATHHRG